MHFLKLTDLDNNTKKFINPSHIQHVRINEEENTAIIIFSVDPYDYIKVNLEDFLKETGNFL